MFNAQKRAVLENIIPVVFGVLVFFIVVGWDILRFDNIRWLQHYNDSAQHYLGWLYYRYTPWLFPIGANPKFGLDVGSSIFYSDSIPILAFFFKVLSPLLAEPFQYFGLWYLICFVLQSWFAFRLVGLIKDDFWIKICATGLFVFSPPMLLRVICHSALVAHWLLLAALYICLKEVSHYRKWQWLVIVIISSLTHAYLLAMVVVLWATDIFKRLICREANFLALSYESVLVVAGGIISLWQAGYFVLKSGKLVEGYGIYKMNLLSLVNPSVNVHFLGENSFSYVLPNLPLPGCEYEGFNFLGLGIIIVFLAVLPRILVQPSNLKFATKWLPLSFACLFFFLFAITNKIGIGNFEISFPIPESIGSAANLLRSSGRMFWPVFYLMLWCLVFMLLKFYKRNTALLILCAALGVQIVDTRAGWGPIRNVSGVSSNTWDINFSSPFWSEAIKTYKKIRVFPPMDLSSIRNEVAYFAGINKMGTDAAYLARYDNEAQERLKNYYENIFSTGNFDKDTLYIFDENYTQYALKNLHYDTDLFDKIDKYYVVAPGWLRKG